MSPLAWARRDEFAASIRPAAARGDPALTVRPDGADRLVDAA